MERENFCHSFSTFFILSLLQVFRIWENNIFIHFVSLKDTESRKLHKCRMVAANGNLIDLNPLKGMTFIGQ